MTIENVREFYSCHSRKETAKHFNVSESELRKFLKANGLQRKGPGFNGDELTTKNRLKTLRTTVWNDPEKMEEIQKKKKETMIEKYGDVNYNLTKAKETMLERYGVSSYMNHDDFDRKTKDTMLKKYGVDNPLASKEILKKVEDTNLERYGAPNVLSKESTLRKYRDERMKQKYGVTVPIKNEKLKNKIQNTLIRKYGVTNHGLIHKNNFISKEELEVYELIKHLGFEHNGHKLRFHERFSDGKDKYPDYINFEERIVVEYNGAYWHKDENQPKYWKEEWAKLGYEVYIIWDFEKEDLLKIKNLTLKTLKEKFPCTFRTRE